MDWSHGRRGPLADRFWEKVDMDVVGPGCWFWRGKANGDGYGRIWDNSVKKTRKPHHIAMELLGYPLPEWPMVCDHMCRTRNCVNPSHVRIVHQGINTTENSFSVWALNKAKTHCGRCNRPLSGENIALLRRPLKSGRVTLNRYCLHCWPSYRNNPHRVFADVTPGGVER